MPKKQENTGIKIPVRKKQELFEVKIEKQEKTGKTGTARGLSVFGWVLDFPELKKAHQKYRKREREMREFNHSAIFEGDGGGPQ